MLVGVASGILRDVLPPPAPVAAVGLVLDFVVIALVYRAEMARPFDAPPHPHVKVHGFLMAKGLAASAAMLVFFFAGAPVSVVALTAGAALLLTRRVKPEKVFVEINWNLLTFFAGLFVVVGRRGRPGWRPALRVLHAREAHSTRPDPGRAILSNLVSNVPAVMLFTHLIPSPAGPDAGLADPGHVLHPGRQPHLLGSIANLIVAEGAADGGADLVLRISEGRRPRDRG
jgi:Na+/H+ antiporter NhaD/arsenite permease-like protein